MGVRLEDINITLQKHICPEASHRDRTLRRIFRPKRDENGVCREFHNEELLSLYRSPNIVSMTNSRRWSGHVARMEEGRIAFKNVSSNPTGKRPLGRLRSRWENNITMDLKEISIITRNWVDSAEVGII